MIELSEILALKMFKTVDNKIVRNVSKVDKMLKNFFKYKMLTKKKFKNLTYI